MSLVNESMKVGGRRLENISIMQSAVVMEAIELVSKWENPEDMADYSQYHRLRKAVFEFISLLESISK